LNRTFITSLCAVFGTMAVLFVVGCGGNTPADSATANLVSNPAIQGHGITLTPASSIQGSAVGNILIPDSTKEQGPGFARTNHLVLNGKSTNQPAAFSGWSPSQMRTCYGITGSGSGTIVIVDAYHDKFALNDFNTFSAQYGLPQETSTNVTASTNQHLQLVYAQGSQPRYNSGWSQEESLDIEWAHAMAPNAKIILVECASNSNNNLYGGDDLAATLGHQCSNSWSGGESSGEASADSHFIHAGTTYYFAGGDTGGVRGYPTESTNVVGVGGTSVSLNANGTRASETAWSGTGCGPSAYIGIPSFQAGHSDGVHRGDDDISAVGDPNTGVSVHWNTGWYIFGGTSVGTPMIAGMVNTSGTNRASSIAENVQIYSQLGTSNLYDVTSGTAGSFSATTGWDYPTGCGTPNGTGAF
jgi:kumamolisin